MHISVGQKDHEKRVKNEDKGLYVIWEMEEHTHLSVMRSQGLKHKDKAGGDFVDLRQPLKWLASEGGREGGREGGGER